MMGLPQKGCLFLHSRLVESVEAFMSTLILWRGAVFSLDRSLTSLFFNHPLTLCIKPRLVGALFQPLRFCMSHPQLLSAFPCIIESHLVLNELLYRSYSFPNAHFRVPRISIGVPKCLWVERASVQLLAHPEIHVLNRFLIALIDGRLIAVNEIPCAQP